MRPGTRNRLFWLLLAVVGACRGQAADPVILSLGDEVVRRSDFERHLKAVEARGGPLAPGVRSALLEPYLEERVLVLEARAQGLIKPGGSAEEEQKGIQLLLAERVLSQVRVSDDEIERYYEAHREELRAPETVTLGQILLATENEARDVRRRLLREPKSFDLLARSRSRSPEAASGGLMGTFARGQLPPELESAAFALSVGGLSDVVVTSLGYHVLKLEAREPARERGLEECRGEIRDLLSRKKADQSVREFVRGLLSRAKVNHEAAQTAADAP